MDPNDLLNEMASAKAPAKKKCVVPVIKIDDPIIVEAVKQMKKASRSIKEYESIIANSEAILRPRLLEERRKYIKESGINALTISVNNDLTFGVKSSKAYSGLNMNSKQVLEEIFKDEFTNCFKVTNGISVKSSAVSDPKVLKDLIDTLGAEKFKDIFEVKQSLDAKSELINKRDTDPKICEMHDKAIKSGAMNIITIFKA